MKIGRKQLVLASMILALVVTSSLEISLLS